MVIAKKRVAFFKIERLKVVHDQRFQKGMLVSYRDIIIKSLQRIKLLFLEVERLVVSGGCQGYRQYLRNVRGF